MEDFLDKYLYSWTGKYSGRAKLTEHGLPVYSNDEEILNSITHFSGIPLGILAIIFTITNYTSEFGLASGLIFGITTLLVYLSSGIYHAINPENYKLKQIFRIIDRASIFLLIAGTCTPFILYSSHNSIVGFETIYNHVIWLIAFAGVAMLSIDLTKYKSITVVMYVLMAVSLFFFFTELIDFLPVLATVYLLAGAGSYLIGFIFFGLGTTTPWMHTVFHVFCLLGSVLHGFCILQFLI